MTSRFLVKSLVGDFRFNFSQCGREIFLLLSGRCAEKAQLPEMPAALPVFLLRVAGPSESISNAASIDNTRRIATK
jgi:hypothetical protein